ncbi:hypothetical protein J6590_033697 [Homalodisca vitripennis]|nr:hypothetical protein J6590_033697 [Homalodisca vitripennis]
MSPVSWATIRVSRWGCCFRADKGDHRRRDYWNDQLVCRDGVRFQSAVIKVTLRLWSRYVIQMVSAAFCGIAAQSRAAVAVAVAVVEWPRPPQIAV